MWYEFEGIGVGRNASSQQGEGLGGEAIRK